MKGQKAMPNKLKILTFFLVGIMLSSCAGGGLWYKKDQAVVNAYFEKQINEGKMDFGDLCDHVRENEFDLAKDPSSTMYSRMARKSRRAYEQISEKKRGSDYKCPEPTATEIRTHLYRAERMRADRKEASKSLGEAAKALTCAAMGGCLDPSTRSSSNNGRLEELERKQKEDKFWREYNCPNDMWRKGYC